jgi:hypothetical protein
MNAISLIAAAGLGLWLLTLAIRAEIRHRREQRRLRNTLALIDRAIEAVKQEQEGTH